MNGMTILPLDELNTLIQIQTKASYEVTKSEVAKFARALEEANNKKLIAISSRLYFLYKKNLPQIVDAYYIRAAAKQSDIGGIVECITSGSSRENETPAEPYLPPIVLFTHASIHYTPHLFGSRVTRHEWGWSCDQYLMDQNR